MKQTTTEILIEVEETIYVLRGRTRSAVDPAGESPVIDVCPHCHRAIVAEERESTNCKSLEEK